MSPESPFAVRARRSPGFERPVIESVSSRTTRRVRAPSSPATCARSASCSPTTSSRRRPGPPRASSPGGAFSCWRWPRCGPTWRASTSWKRERTRCSSGAATRARRPGTCLPTEPSTARSSSSIAAPSSSACTRTGGGRRRAAPSSTQARSSPASSTPPSATRRCWESRARRTSRRRSRRSTAGPPRRGWSATTSRPTSAAPSGVAFVASSCARASSGTMWSPARASSRTRSWTRLPTSPTTWRDARRRRPDRDRSCPARARALPRLRRALLHRGRARVLRLAAESGAELRRPLRREGGRWKGARVRRPVHVEGDRDRRPPQAWRAALGPHEGVGAACPRRRDRPLDDALARARCGDLRRLPAVTAFDPLYTAAEMSRAEEGYPGYPETIEELMDAAGSAVAEQLMRRFPAARAITAVCGGGANGGDGRIAAQRLRDAGRRVRVVDVKAAPDEHDLGSPDVVLDALFGTGFHGTPRAEAAELIDAMNGLGVPIVAVDVPSGVDASTGEIGGAAVRATLTVTFHAPKVGLHVAPGRFHAGDMIVVDIGLEHLATEHALVREEILAAVPARSVADTKYTAGSVLVVGGSPGLTGAPSLAAEAAFRADAGYVAVAAPREALPVLETRLLEAVKRPLDEVWDAVGRASALAVGPGLGREPDRGVLVRRLLLETNLPAVVDADGLWGLEPFERSAATVLTPHSGE